MRRRGFTFVELLVALSLFMIGMVSILLIFPLNRRFLLQSSNATQAVTLAQEEIEQVCAVDYSDLTIGTYEANESMGTSSTDPLSQYTRTTTVTIVDSSQNAIATQDTAHDVGIKRIDATVYWNEHGVSRQYTLSTYAYE